MSHQEKRTLVSVLAETAILITYCIYAAEKAQTSSAMPVDLKSWAMAILTFLSIGIAAMIIIQIIFHILFSISLAITEQVKHGTCNDPDLEKKIGKSIKLEMAEDEMDELIGLKSSRIGFAVVSLGFIAALLALIFNYSSVVMLNTLFISFIVATMSDGLTQIYFYHSGVKNG